MRLSKLSTMLNLYGFIPKLIIQLCINLQKFYKFISTLHLKTQHRSSIFLFPLILAIVFLKLKVECAEEFSKKAIELINVMSV